MHNSACVLLFGHELHQVNLVQRETEICGELESRVVSEVMLEYAANHRYLKACSSMRTLFIQRRDGQVVRAYDYRIIAIFQNIGTVHNDYERWETTD